MPYHFFCAFFLSPVHLYVALLCCIWPRVHFKFQGEWRTTSITTFLKNKNIADKKSPLSVSFCVVIGYFTVPLLELGLAFPLIAFRSLAIALTAIFTCSAIHLAVNHTCHYLAGTATEGDPEYRTLCAHTKWACSAAAAPGFTLLILRLNRHRSEATFRNTHTACIHCKHVQEPPSLTNLELRPCCLLWLSRLPHIWQNYPRNMTSVCMWGTLRSIISSFVKRQHSRKEAHFTLQKRCFEPLSFGKNGGCPLDYESMSKCWNM